MPRKEKVRHAMSQKNERQRLKPHRRGTPIEPATPSRPAGRPAARARTARARQEKPRLFPVAIVLAVLFAVGCALGIRAALTPASEAPPVPEDPERVSFVAVGDNLPEIEIAGYADAQAGEVDDGEYDYSPIYAPIRDYVQAADLAYVKQETHLGGDDIGPKGYPSFNTTDAMADAIVDTGFDLVGSASNHAEPEAANELEGMLSCDFVHNSETGEVSVENVSWTPLVMHEDDAGFAVYALKDYTADLAAAYPTLSTLDDPIAWLRDTSERVVNSLGDDFAIDA